MEGQASAARRRRGRAGARPVRPRPAPARRRGADAARLRHRRGGARACGPAHMGLDPDDLDYAWLRRYAAHLSERGAAPSTLARKLASLRAFYRVLLEHGDRGREPGGPAAGAQAAPAPAADAQGRRRGRPARPDPRRHAARAARPGAVRARLRQRPARGGARQPRRGLDRLRRASRSAWRARAARRASCPAGSTRCGRSTRYLERARAHAGGRSRRARALPLQVRPAALDLRRPPPPAHLGAARGGPGRGPPARPAALLRDPSAGGRGRPPGHPGAAGALLAVDDAGLHSGRVSAAACRLCAQPSRERRRRE